MFRRILLFIALSSFASVATATGPGGPGAGGINAPTLDLAYCAAGASIYSVPSVDHVSLEEINATQLAYAYTNFGAWDGSFSAKIWESYGTGTTLLLLGYDFSLNGSHANPAVFRHDMVLVENPPLPQISGVSVVLTTLDGQFTNDVDVSMQSPGSGYVDDSASADCWHSNYGS